VSRFLQQRNFSNILIIKPSSLGDVVRCLPILAGLRRRFPDARISWMLRPDCADILKTSPYLNDIIAFDRYHYGKIGRNNQATRGFISFLNFLRRRNFDLVLDLQGLFRSAFMGLCTAAPVRLGFAHAREFSPLFYTHRVAIPHRAEHVVDSYWRFAKHLGFGAQTKYFDLPIDPTSQKSAKKLLSRSGLPTNKTYAALLIGGTESAKRWPPECFAALALVLQKRYHIDNVALGAGAEEAAAAGQMQQCLQQIKSKARIINLVDKTSLIEATAIIKNARLVVGNDSGLLHIAAALSSSVVGLYGPTDPVVVGPYGHSDGVVRAGTARPLNQRYSIKPEHRIQNITLDEVLKTVGRKMPTNQRH
jgi:heptosyltransferase-1